MLWLNTIKPIAKATAGSSAKSTPAVDGLRRRSAWSSQAKPSTIAIKLKRIREAYIKQLPAQLERKSYEAVNKVLELLGGKWKRSAQGHSFEDDPAVVVANALEAGTVEDAVKKYQFYPTPAPVAKLMVEAAQIEPGHLLLEPSAGTGSILEHLPEEVQVTLCEANPDMAKALEAKGWPIHKGDFLDYHSGPVFDRIVANPPFSRGQDVAHVSHMLDCLKEGGRMVAIMSAGISFRQDRATAALLERMEKECKDFSITPLDAGAFRESGTMVNAVMVVVQR